MYYIHFTYNVLLIKKLFFNYPELMFLFHPFKIKNNFSETIFYRQFNTIQITKLIY